MVTNGFNGNFNNSAYNRCGCCQHSAVCSLKADYEKQLHQALTIACKPFELDLRCPHFLSMAQTRTFIYGSDSTSSTLDGLATQYHVDNCCCTNNEAKSE